MTVLSPWRVSPGRVADPAVVFLGTDDDPELVSIHFLPHDRNRLQRDRAEAIAAALNQFDAAHPPAGTPTGRTVTANEFRSWPREDQLRFEEWLRDHDLPVGELLQVTIAGDQIHAKAGTGAWDRPYRAIVASVTSAPPDLPPAPAPDPQTGLAD